MNTTLNKRCVICGETFPQSVNRCPVDDVMLSEADTQVGQIVDGKYQIVSFVGVGGTGRVYKANHIDLNRTIALKFLKSSDRIDLQRFRREAVSISQLRHRFIATVFSFSVSTDGKAYLAMEYLDGRSLQAAIEEGIAPESAVQLVSQIAEGLSAAHAQGIIHRDIKPGNVILVEDGEEQIPKLLDFGMARLTLDDKEQSLTQTGEIFGTRQYISPEQYNGVPADHRADIYSLGMLLYEAVVKDGKVPEPLRPILERALASEPTDRFQSMDSLREHLSKVTIEPNTCKYVSLSSEWVDRRQSFWNWYLLSICLGLLCMAIAVVLFVNQTVRSAAKQAEPSVLTAHHSHHLPVAMAALLIKVDDLLDEDRADEAESLCNKWTARQKGFQQLEPEDLARLNLRRARCARSQRRYTDALPLFQSVNAYFEAHQDNHQADLIDTRCELSQLLRLMDQNDRAEKLILESLPIARDSYSRELLELSLLRELGQIYQAKRLDALAEKQLKLCIEKARNNDSNVSADCGSCQTDLGVFYYNVRRLRESDELLANARDSFERLKVTPQLLLARADLHHGSTLMALNRHKEAVTCLTQAWHIYEAYTGNASASLKTTGEMLQSCCDRAGVPMPADVAAKWKRFKEGNN